MKHKIFNGVTAMIIASSVLFSSCVGSFTMSNTVLKWNNKVGGKFVNELVFIVFNIVPVYGVSLFIDAVVLNTIEFWTGSNPMAQIDKTVEGENGTYTVKSNENGYTITDVNTGAVTLLNYNNNTCTWSATVNGTTIDFLTFVDGNHVKVCGSENAIELSENGVMSYKQQLRNMYPDFALAY